jgi:hypothetical protein
MRRALPLALRGDLAHHFATEVIAVGQIIARGVSSRTPPLASSVMASSCTTRSRAPGVLDDDGADAIAFDAVEQPCQAIPVAVGDLEACPLGEGLAGIPLPGTPSPGQRRRCRRRRGECAGGLSQPLRFTVRT